MKFRKTGGLAALVAALAFVPACGGGSSSSANSGSAAVLIKDATYDQLGTFEVTFSKGVLKGTGGTSDYTLFTTAQTVDLLKLSLESSFLAAGDVPEGSYSGLELTVSAISATDTSKNTLTFDGASMLPVTVPLVFATPLTVQKGSPIDILLDFDVKRSYTETGATSFSMQPVVKPDPDPPAVPVDGVEITVQSIDKTAGTFTGKTTTAPYRTLKVRLDSSVPYVVNYETVYIGTTQILGALTTGTKVSLDGGEYNAGSVLPDFLITGADKYPTNFVIVGGTVTAVNTTTNEITLQPFFVDADNTGGQVTTIVNNGGTIKVTYSDANQQLLLSKYGKTKTAAGDQATVGMPIGFGGTWDPTAQTLTPILGVSDNGSHIEGSLASAPANVSGTVWKFTLQNGTKNGQSFTSLDVFVDLTYGKVYRAGKVLAAADFATLKAGDSFKGETGWSFDNNREELVRGLVGAKSLFISASNLNMNSIDVSGDPVKFSIQVTQSNNLTELGKTSAFTMNVELPLDGNLFQYNQTSGQGSDVKMTNMGSMMQKMGTNDGVYLVGYFDSGTNTFHANEVTLNFQ